jgi:hypothetical protein
MACTGSIFAAMDAGIMPDRIPKMIHRVMERRIFPQERKILNFNRRLLYLQMTKLISLLEMISCLRTSMIAI